MPMTGDGDTDFNVLRHTFKDASSADGMSHTMIGFPPCRIDRGRDTHVMIGTRGELARINNQGEISQPFTMPFPAPSIDGVVIGDRWVGIWLEREFGEARMAALPMGEEWFDGPGREELRLTPSDGGITQPKGAIWHRTLDSEPMKMGRVSDNIVFSTFGGMYMIDLDANEKWRAQIPSWPEISKIGVRDSIVSVGEIPGAVTVWSRAGGVAALDPVDGSLLFSNVNFFGDIVSNATYSEQGGWMVSMHGNSFALLDSIESEPRIITTPGPVLDSGFVEGEWRWTGWRHDGRLSEEGIHASRRDSIGVALLDGKVITNDGKLRDFSA